MIIDTEFGHSGIIGFILVLAVEIFYTWKRMECLEVPSLKRLGLSKVADAKQATGWHATENLLRFR